MTIPAQRQASGPDTGAWRLLEAINRVDDSVRVLSTDMAARFDRLDERFMSRREASAHLEESLRDRADLRAQVGQERTQREADIDALTKRLDAEDKAREDREAEQRRERTTTRRWLVTTALACFGACSGVVFGVINHFQ